MTVKTYVDYAAGIKPIAAQITIQIVIVLAQVSVAAVECENIISAVVTVGDSTIVAVIDYSVGIADAGAWSCA